jgi:hypothetical protein
MKWEPYDPSWLVSLALEKFPDRPWLAESLAACTRCRWKRDIYVHFVDPTNGNQPGSEWQFDYCLPVLDPNNGNLILDVLKDRRIGGIEFHDRLFSTWKGGQGLVLRLK